MFSRLLRFLRSKTYKKPSSSLPSAQASHPRFAATASIPPREEIKAVASTSPNDLTTTDGGAVHPKRVLILDLGDVLFHYSLSSITALSAPTFSSLIKSPGWAALECGLITEDIAVQRISKDLDLEINTINKALAQCRQLLHVDHDLFSELITMKQDMNGSLEVYAMTNISCDDFARLKILALTWTSLFDKDFTSFEVGKIKPDLGYYQHVINSIGLSEPSMAVFVDDKKVNVDAARSFGIHGIMFESAGKLMQELREEFLGSQCCR
jgi:FMN phosphatase YigB (HAD superfamily)